MNLAQAQKLFNDTLAPEALDDKYIKAISSSIIYGGGKGSGRHKEIDLPGKAKVVRRDQLVKTESLRSMDKYNQYKSNLNDKKSMSPLLVIPFGKSGKYQVADGHHRLAAYDSLHIKNIPVKVLSKGNDGWKEFHQFNQKKFATQIKNYLNAGGPGSGRHKTGRREKDAGRQSRGIDSYKPSTKAKQLIAEANEKLLTKMIGCCHMGDNKPFDVIHKGQRIGFEVKTKVDGKKNTITMHPDSRRRKLSAFKSMKLSEMYTVVFDDRPGQNKIYYAKGVGSFQLDAKNPSVKEVSSLKQLKKEIGL